MTTRVWIERIVIAFTLPFYLILLGLVGLMMIAQDIRKAPVKEESE